jgi:hypothetical protein
MAGGSATPSGDGGFDLACSRGWCALSPLPFGTTGSAVASDGTTVAVANALGVVWRLDNNRWVRITDDGLGAVLSLRVFGPNDIWATGRSRLIAHFDGTSWTRLTPPVDMDSQAGVWGVWGPDAQTVWFTAVGSVSSSPKIWRWTSAGFTSFSTGTSTAGFYGVWGASPNSVYFVGPSSQVVRFNGVGLVPVTVPAGDFFDIDGSGPNDIHVVGAAGAIRWNGTAWSVSSTQANLNAITVMPSRDAWAVGTGGKTLYWDGTAWSVAPVVTTRSLVDVASHGAEAWAVGADSELLHLSGLQWSSQRRAPMPPATNVIAGTDATFVYSDGGAVFLRSGSTFTLRPERNVAFPSAVAANTLWDLTNTGISRGTDAGFVQVAACPTTSCQGLRQAHDGRLTFTSDYSTLWEFLPADGGVRSLNYFSPSGSTATMPAPNLLIAVQPNISNFPTRYATFAADGGGWSRRTVEEVGTHPANSSLVFPVQGEGALFNTYSAFAPSTTVSAVWVSVDGGVKSFLSFTDLQSIYTAFVPFNGDTVFLLRRTSTPTLSLILPDGGTRVQDVPGPQWLSCEPNRTCTAITNTGAVFVRD